MDSTSDPHSVDMDAVPSQVKNFPFLKAAPVDSKDKQRMEQAALAYEGAWSDFSRLPSHPLAIYKTGSEWRKRPPPEAYSVNREARPVLDHPMRPVWHELGEAVYRYLDSRQVRWTSIDPVRFVDDLGLDSGLYLWIGVIPASLTFEDAKAAASGCKNILSRAGFSDVEISFRESVFQQSVGPKLGNAIHRGPIGSLCAPFTSFLGIQIATAKNPNWEGTGTLYIHESRTSSRTFLLTARHVALPPPVCGNNLFAHRNQSQPRNNILALGTGALSNAMSAIQDHIDMNKWNVECYEAQLETCGQPSEAEDPEITKTRGDVRQGLAEAKQAITETKLLQKEKIDVWGAPENRLLGHVVYAPPVAVGVGPQKHTEDWALVELDQGKIDWNTFKGNVIHLGNVSGWDLWKKFHPHAESRPSFKYPVDGLLRITGIVQEEDIRRPTQLDASGEGCLIVLKNGRTTGLTVGRVSGIESIVRHYADGTPQGTSMEIAVYSYSNKDGAFSDKGDSGAVVATGHGEIVGMITGGAGCEGAIDVTYVTPYYFIEERIRVAFPESYLY